MEITNDEIEAFASEHLAWIHGIEEGIRRRLSEYEIMSLMELTLVRGFDARIKELNTLTIDINEATTNFIEGILG